MLGRPRKFFDWERVIDDRIGILAIEAVGVLKMSQPSSPVAQELFANLAENLLRELVVEFGVLSDIQSIERIFERSQKMQ